DGTTYTLGDNLVVGQTVSGTLLTAVATSTTYGNTQTTDDFGTLTRTFTWQNNVHTQSWSLAFSAGYTATTVYASMWPTDNSVYKVFRYADMGSNLNVLLPNGISSGGNEYVSTGAATSNIFYGGKANLKVTFATTATVTSNFLWVVDVNYHKSYFRIGSWEKVWSDGETMGGHTTTITLDYQTPASVSWTGKTLFVPKPMTISTATELLPFNGNGLVVKTRANGTAALTFSGVAPTKNYFTSGHDDSIGTEESWNSTGTPAKGNWPGVTVSGDVSASYNIFNYATTGLTLSSNANAYNNSFNQNTTGINAGVGSTVRNNALANTTTYTAGSGDFDYDCFSGNAETNGVDGDPSFTSAAGGDLTLQSSSPCIDVGSNLGVSYQSAVNPTSVWPTSITTINQSLRGSGWEIGAYIHPVPQAATIGAGSALSASSIRWSFTDNADDEVGFRVYDGTDTLMASSAATDLTYLDETGLSENTQYSGRYAVAYNTYGNAAASSPAAAKYTLAAIPTALAVTASTKNSLTLSVDALPNDTSGSSGYYFSRTGANSGWIQTNTWQDTQLGCGVSYLYSIKYRNGDSVESDTISLTGTTNACGSSSASGSGVPATTYALTLTSPQGGEHVVAGEMSAITWVTGGTGNIGSVDIWYSLDNGASYLLIADNASNTGSYAWQTPGVDSENVSVKVEATDLISVLASGVSSSFWISQPTNGTLTSPGTSEIVYGVSPFDGSTEAINPLASYTYFRGSDYDTVYLLTADGVRRPFINESIFFTWQKDFSDVLTVSNATLAYYALGAPMLPNPGVALVKIQSDPKVYAVEEDPNDNSKVVIRHIASEATAVSVYGANWADSIIDLPPTLFAHLTEGTQITDAVGMDVMSTQRRTELGS
ncbi:MAG: hypothetical protein NUV56_03820, partial [Candidatus Uhrbacteria bacterium]|nr:hypothetical protein [Candidatus Uhrbacteria bacterium]